MGATKPQIAILPSSYEEMLRTWGRIAKFHESASIYLYGQSMVAFRHQDLVTHPEYVKKYFGGKLPALIDASAFCIEDADDFERVFLLLEQTSQKPSVFIICNIDRYVLEKNKAIFFYLKKRHIQHPNQSYLLFFSIDILHPQFASFIQNAPILQENTIIHSLPTIEDSEQFVGYLQKKWQIHIPKDIEKSIIYMCSRHMWLIKEAVRYFRDTRKVQIKDVFHHDMMKMRLQITYEKLLYSEQSVMQKIVLGNNDFTGDEMHSITFLKQTGWIEAQRGKLGITTPIIAEYIKERIKPIASLLWKDTDIYFRDVPVTRLFSEKEQRILRELLIRKGTVVSRDQLAAAIWGTTWEEQYSDWAIDQLIARLRKKLMQFSFAKTTIKAVKGKGFVYAV